MNKKHLLFLVIAIASFTTTNAQLAKGDVLLGATLGYNNGRQEMPNSVVGTASNANLSPRLGLLVGNNSVVGIAGAFVHQKQKSDNGTNIYNAYGGGLYWRKYLPIKNQFGWYVNVDGSMSFGKRKDTPMGQSEYVTKVTSYGAGVTPGFYYQPLRSLIVNVDFGGVAYEFNKNKSNSGGTPYVSKTSAVGLSLLSTFSFGIDFVINKKKA
jgi:hypothetical protein